MLVSFDGKHEFPDGKGQQFGSMFSPHLIFGDAQKESNNFGAILEQGANMRTRMDVQPVEKSLAEYHDLRFGLKDFGRIGIVICNDFYKCQFLFQILAKYGNRGCEDIKDVNCEV